MAAALLLMAAWPGQAGAGGAADAWWGRDKAVHALAAAVVGAGAADTLHTRGRSPCDAARIGVLFPLTGGLIKELADPSFHRSPFSWRDLAWDLAGGIAGAAVVTGCGR